MQHTAMEGKRLIGAATAVRCKPSTVRKAGLVLTTFNQEVCLLLSRYVTGDKSENSINLKSHWPVTPQHVLKALCSASTLPRLGYCYLGAKSARGSRNSAI